MNLATERIYGAGTMLDIDDIDSDDETEAAPPPKRSRAPLLIGLALFVLLGAGGFYAMFSGIVTLPTGQKDENHRPSYAAANPEDAPTFVPIGEMVIPLGPNANAKFLVIDTQIETRREDAAALEALRPRILDVFNTFLRAVEESDIEAPSATIRLRAQLLRRASAVAAPIQPRDLLITSFVLK